MVRGLRVLRYVVIAAVLLLVVYKLTSNKVDLSEYANIARNRAGEVVHGTPGGLSSPAEPAKDLPLTQEKPQSQTPPVSVNPNEPYERANATFVSLARNEDLWELIASVREVEDRFNHKYHYDWVFLNDKEFTEEFKKVTTEFVSGTTHYGFIPKEHWSYPEWISEEKAALTREDMKNIIYGSSESYRHMCRFESGFFWRNEALKPFKYYWRVEPHIKLFCDIDYDLFKYMETHKKKYGFTISLYEYEATIKTLWQTVKGFLAEFPQYLHPNNGMDFISDDGGETYNLCHFWSNFEIGDLDFWRGEAYGKFFEYLDKAGGFFYERWGDAPVHSIAAALFMDKNDMHFFHDVGYWHVPFQNCPVSEADRLRLHCTCPNDGGLPADQRNIFTWRGYSCTPRFHKVLGIDRPEGWYEHADK